MSGSIPKSTVRCDAFRWTLTHMSDSQLICTFISSSACWFLVQGPPTPDNADSQPLWGTERGFPVGGTDVSAIVRNRPTTQAHGRCRAYLWSAWGAPCAFEQFSSPNESRGSGGCCAFSIMSVPLASAVRAATIRPEWNLLI